MFFVVLNSKPTLIRFLLAILLGLLTRTNLAFSQTSPVLNTYETAFSDVQTEAEQWVTESFNKFLSGKDTASDIQDLAIRAAIEQMVSSNNPPIFIFLHVDKVIISKIIEDREFAEAATHTLNVIQKKFYGKEAKTAVKDVISDARTIMGRLMLPNLVAGETISEKEFVQQAEIANFPLQNYPKAYRYDTRPPEIIKISGFGPNPNKKPMTLIENSMPKADGGGNFVALTLQENNDHIVRTYYFPKDEIKPEAILDILNLIKASQKFVRNYDSKEIQIPLAQQNFKSIRTFRTYQYTIEKIVGADSSSVGTLSESEIVARTVRPTQITSYRVVYYFTFDYKGNMPHSATYYGPWLKLN